MKHVIFAVFITLSSLTVFCAPEGKSLDKVLSELDKTLSHRKEYLTAQRERIDSLCAMIPITPVDARGHLYFTIAESFSGVSFDSTRYYYERAQESFAMVPDAENAALARSYAGAVLPLIGVIPEGIRGYMEGEKEMVTPSAKLNYYFAGVLLYERLISVYPNDQNLDDEYRRRIYAAADSIVKYAPMGSEMKHYANAIIYEKNREYSLMIAELNDVLETASPYSQLYGPAATKLGDYYSERSDTEEAVYYYALAATNAIKSCNFAAIALQHLGLLMNDMGDNGRSFDYLTASFNEAVSSDNRLRAMQVSNAFPVIDSAYRRRHLMTLTALWVVSGLLVVLLIVLLRQWRNSYTLKDRIHQLEEALVVANEQKVNNVGHFLSFCSIYLERFEEFSRTARRKLKAGQIEDLYEMINSNKMSDAQTRDFLKVFDKSFLHIFPTFVNDVNLLLREDSRFGEIAEEQLSTELRILAFIRLGINDSNRIAKFMGLSINTIYTYRNKMRGRALERDTFEVSIEHIGAI